MDSVARKVEKMLLLLQDPVFRPVIVTKEGNLAVITCAASLANHGLLRSMDQMKLQHCSPKEMKLKFKYNVVDLTSVPAEHLASLVSCVTGGFYISNVIGCDLINILDNVKSIYLNISRQSLGTEETQALVRAMESRVEWVVLFEEVTLDIRSLREYSGQGKCRRVDCYCDTQDRYREQLVTWAKSKNWDAYKLTEVNFTVERLASHFPGSWKVKFL